LFVALLVTGCRPGALVSRDVLDFDPRASRIDLGRGLGNKRRGDAAVDPKTRAELGAYTGERKKGPLCVSPTGVRLSLEKVLDYWREAFSLGLVQTLWPKDEPFEPRLAYLVSRSLRSGRIRVSRGGNPLRMKSATIEAREILGAKVKTLVEKIGPAWKKQMAGVAAYGLRTTHRTWAELKGVPGVVIDKQLGHGKRSEEKVSTLERLLGGSATGRNHYIDPALFDAVRSATAVREMLDGAEAALAQSEEGTLTRAEGPDTQVA
jgi:integrase